MGKTEESTPDKMSAALEQRLRQAAPDELVQAIVLLDVPDSAICEPQRGDAAARRAAAAAVIESARVALPDVDHTLQQFRGRRLTPTADALGTVRVETTAEGVRALARSDHVRAILEDQSLFGLEAIRSSSPL